MAHESLHELPEHLSPKTKDMHRALLSLQEELEAVDWYQQRADACTDADLKAILLHNMEEEVEHAAMVLEWIRRKHGVFDSQLKEYLFKTAPVVAIEEGGGEAEGAEPPPNATLRSTIGSLRRKP